MGGAGSSKLILIPLWKCIFNLFHLLADLLVVLLMVVFNRIPQPASSVQGNLTPLNEVVQILFGDLFSEVHCILQPKWTHLRSGIRPTFRDNYMKGSPNGLASGPPSCFDLSLYVWSYKEEVVITRSASSRAMPESEEELYLGVGEGPLL